MKTIKELKEARLHGRNRNRKPTQTTPTRNPIPTTTPEYPLVRWTKPKEKK